MYDGKKESNRMRALKHWRRTLESRNLKQTGAAVERRSHSNLHSIKSD